MSKQTVKYHSRSSRQLQQWKAKFAIKASSAFWLTLLLLTLTFLMGGSSRSDVASLMVLRPAAFLIGAAGLLTLRREHVTAYRWLFIAVGVMLVWLALQIVPLGPSLFAALPGRGLITGLDGIAKINGAWRPMSLVPDMTSDALWACVVPFAALVLLVQLDSDEHRYLLIVLLVFGALSASLGLVQIFGDPAGPLVLYDRAKGQGDAAGFFANKNHQAVFLSTLIPMLGAMKEIRRVRVKKKERAKTERVLINVALLAIIPMLLIANSRAGLLTGVLGFLSLPIVFRRRAKSERHSPYMLGGMVAGAAILSALSIWAGRALAWDRLIKVNPVDDLRYKILPSVRAMILEYLPLGSGTATFEKLYITHEPDQLLSPIVMNQVHDDWLDALLTSGGIGVLVIAMLLGIWLFNGLSIMKSDSLRTRIYLARAAWVASLLFAVGSLSDYPARTPIVECVLVIFVVWLVGAMRGPESGSPSSSERLISGRNISRDTI